MCLLKQSTKLKATKDIVCYKVCKCVPDTHYYDDGLYSFFFSYKWNLNKVYEAEHARPALTKYSIYNGYFHTFEDQESADDLMKHENTVLVKCIIPNGTYYYKGIHAGGKWGYASKKLKIVEIVK